MRYDIHSIGGGLASTLVRKFDAVSGSDYASESVFLGYMDRPTYPPVQSFPFDIWLTLEMFHPIACVYRMEDGPSWEIVNIALTHVCDVEIEDRKSVV